MLSAKDHDLLKHRGISPDTLDAQLNRFREGFPFLRLASSATIGNGILAIDDELERAAIERWKTYLADGGSVCKFVPASGAASRMFKALFAFVNGADDVPVPGSDVAEVIANIDVMPFASALNDQLVRLHGADAKTLISEGRYKDVIAGIVHPEGMNYGGLPKGLLLFHKYNDGTVRTPVEEQLMEGAQSAATDGKVTLHFTVSENHKGLFADKINEVLPALQEKTGLSFDVSMSTQSPATDTVGANPDNTPFRDDEGNLVFRPGGHGALITNLNDIKADVIFIKNIDNVVPDSHREATIRYKKIIAGVLVLVHDSIVHYTEAIAAGRVDDVLLAEMKDFARTMLNIHCEGLDAMPREEQIKWLYAKFDRPLRVCGMVRNEGEPGGGPYIAYNADGTASPQILESTQIDMANPEYVEMMKTATHFNPVDLVCYTTGLDGKKYDLSAYVDHNTGFISSKSYAGRELKALELPGLWNGAMSDWNTIFVEVPVSTFNPVKTVNDLLRPAHRSDIN